MSKKVVHESDTHHRTACNEVSYNNLGRLTLLIARQPMLLLEIFSSPFGMMTVFYTTLIPRWATHLLQHVHLTVN